MQCNLNISNNSNTYLYIFRFNQLELSLNNIYTEAAIRYYHTGENALENNLMIINQMELLLSPYYHTGENYDHIGINACKTIIYLINILLYNFILKINFASISFIIALLIFYLFNHLHYIFILYLPNYVIHKWNTKHDHIVKHLYGSSTKLFITHLILNILESINQQSFAHTNIQLYVTHYYKPYQIRYRDGL